MWFLVVIVVSVVAVAYSLTQPSIANLNPNVVMDYDVFGFENLKDVALNWVQMTGKYESTGKDYSAFVAQFHPSKFSFYPPTKDGCTKLVQPSVSSWSTYTCEYATNGGFFTWDTTKPSLCIGNLISDGHVWQIPTDGTGSNRANFGITQDSKIITGFVGTSPTSLYNFTNLMTGVGWLVRNGQGNVESSPDLNKESTFTTEKAPRTAVGVFKNGTMVLVEIDGEEDINYGPDLFEMAEFLVSIGVESAINLDGGGSSVSVNKGQVVSQPTCKDTPEICERADAAITCVRI